MKHALIQIAPIVLERLLQLPADARIVGATLAVDRAGVVLFRLEGVGFNVPDGCQIPVSTGIVTKTDAGEVIDWGFPKKDQE